MRPYEMLPMPMPAEYDPSEEEPDFFYKNFAKHFVPDMIQMMDTGLNIDQDAVESLRTTVDEVLESVAKGLADNAIIQQYQQERRPYAQKKYAEKCTEAVRGVEYYLKEYKPGDMLHRTWIVNTYLRKIGKDSFIKDKWTVYDLRSLNVFLSDPFIKGIIDKRKYSMNQDVKSGMLALAEYKLELWNRPRYEKAEKSVDMAPFNPNSPKQVKELFEMMNVEPLAYSPDTGEASWGRDQLEIVAKSIDDPLSSEAYLLQHLIDFSFSNIIKTNFLKAFDVFTIDSVLHGNIKIFGAKSFRNTSNSPNLLNAPSTGSIYAKPLKKCFRAPDGMVVYTADLGALEDRVIANVSGDTNKQNIFLEGLDGHSLNACGYFPKKIEKIMGKNVDNVTYVKMFKEFVDEGNMALDAIRQDSKAPTFKLAYGGYPDEEKGGVITQELFDNYHNVLYPGITNYRENYVLPSCMANGFIHLGLGCRLYSSDPRGHIRTLNNATVQFWSILTLIAINEFNYRIREDGLEDHVQVTSTIYDSIYTQNTKHPEVIQWVNNNLIELMCVQYLEDETIHNVAQGEIGPTWAELTKVPNNASIEEIEVILEML